MVQLMLDINAQDLMLTIVDDLVMFISFQTFNTSSSVNGSLLKIVGFMGINGPTSTSPECIHSPVSNLY